MPELFREKALKRLQSPEQLDQLLRVTSTRSWLALAAACAIVITAAVWGYYGSVETKVTGTGVIIRHGGVLKVVAQGSGLLTEIKVSVGENIDKGQVVAVLTDPDLAKRLQAKEAELQELRKNRVRQAELIDREIKSKRSGLRAQRDDVNENVRVQTNRLDWLNKRINTLTPLYDEGLLKEKDLADLRLDRENTHLKISQAQRNLIDIFSQEIELEQSKEDRLFKTQLAIDDVKRDISILRKQSEVLTEVRTSVSGAILEIQASEGEVMKSGQPIFAVQAARSRLAPEVYVPAYMGKRICPGMEIQFTPSTVKREESGFMVGEVRTVSEFPVSSDGMMSVLNNKDLVQSLLKKGPLLSITGAFKTDPGTKSGFKWSSRKGADIQVSSGTLGTGEVVVREQQPVTLVIPILKSLLGVED